MAKSRPSQNCRCRQGVELILGKLTDLIFSWSCQLPTSVKSKARKLYRMLHLAEVTGFAWTQFYFKGTWPAMKSVTNLRIRIKGTWNMWLLLLWTAADSKRKVKPQCGPLTINPRWNMWQGVFSTVGKIIDNNSKITRTISCNMDILTWWKS
jgi:hypothetical protein